MKKMACLGDSLTFGWPYGKDASWVELLKRSFPAIEVYNSGVSGNTFADMLSRVNNDVLIHEPDYCIIMGGTNEVYQKIPQPVLQMNFDKVIKKLIIAKCKIFVGIPLPVDFLPIEAYLADFREWLKGYCSINGLDTIDFYDFLMENNKILTEYYIDVSHLNKEGYKKVGECVVAYFHNFGLIS